MSYPVLQVGPAGVPGYQASPVSATQASPGRSVYAFGGLNALDQFERALTEANPRVTSFEAFRLRLRYPRLSRRLQNNPSPMGVGETPIQQLKMYDVIRKALDGKAKRQFDDLLKEGVLTATDTDNRHSTLYQLYSMLTTPRSPGYDAPTLVRETVEILHQPYAITQRFEPLSENATQQLLQLYNAPSGKWVPGQSVKPLTPEALNVTNSATCVSSSVMYYMADKKPGELARHLNELTSPMNAFHEKVKLSELSPDNPQQAFEMLKERQVPYYISGPDEVTVKIENPPAGIIRAMDSQDMPTGGQYRNAIQAAYQSALTYLATRSYDPATDYRDSDVPGERSVGLTEDEKSFMESIIKDNGGTQSITYQVVNGKANPAPGEEGSPYLYGYFRSFQQMTSDILASLKMGEPVIIGITNPEEDGNIGNGGHEITITGATLDQKTGELKFIVADSDDGVPTLVVRSARELIPRIHHAGFPAKLAREIQQSIQSSNSYFVPDATDAAYFDVLPVQRGPYPQDPPASPPSAAPTSSPTTPMAIANQAVTPAAVTWMSVLVNMPGTAPTQGGMPS